MDREIRKKAAELRRQVLEYIKRKHPHASNARQYLHPKYAAEMLSYDFQVRADLDVELRLVDAKAKAKRGVITGLLDRENRVIAVSERYSPEEQRYSGAHELGHLRLHPHLPTMHRDRLDHSTSDPLERQAEAFAAAYLMPSKWIKRDVKARFGGGPIRITEDLAWWLDRDDQDRLLGSDPDVVFEAALAIATCTNIGNGHFRSMCGEYGVTAMAMARRLIELDLVIG